MEGQREGQEHHCQQPELLRVACPAFHWPAPGGAYRMAMGVGAGSTVAAGLPGHHHSMRCGAGGEIISLDSLASIA